MNTISLNDRLKLDTKFQQVRSHQELFIPLAVSVSLVFASALATLTVIGIYCKSYHITPFDASIRHLTSTSLSLLAVFSPLFIGLVFLAREQKKRTLSLIQELNTQLEDQIRLSSVKLPFLKNELFKGIGDLQMVNFLQAMQRAYPAKAELESESTRFKALQLIEEAIANLEEGRFKLKVEQDYGRKIRERALP